MGGMQPGKDLEKVPNPRKGSVSSETNTVDVQVQRRLLRKLDRHVYPILFVIHMMSFLDRVNISNARIQGLTADLELEGNRFNIALFVPSNMIIRHVTPCWYLPGLMFSWGIINMSMGFVHTYGGLVVLRFFLGAAEAGVFPGIIYLTSMYYKRHEFQIRMSFLFCSTQVAGAFGGLLAYAIAHLDGSLGYRAWRWIFIIEGAATAVVAVIAVFLVVDWPEDCRFLTKAEKDLLKHRLASDGTDCARMDTLNKQACKRIFSDAKIWLASFIYMGVGVPGYSTTFFMPTILLEFGYKAEQAQARTIPVYVVSAAGMLITGFLSDRYKHRYSFIVAGCFIATIGFGILLNQGTLSRDAKFAAIFLVSLGGHIGNPMALAWLSNNVSGHWKRAFSSAFQVTLGNIAGIIAANIFLSDESPAYPTGYGTAFAMLWVAGLSATAMFGFMLVENRRRDAGKRDYRLSQPEEEIKNMGDDHPSFRFTL
ncbi:hypothetical protein JX265_010067 [Neoarthrinium moseri]|uniref:Major facilitator superfamily (MFS) profile domain-containing protein n=1 Tax=Neoarthrinium moseri TaxID=1658444 RepID=A0A9Q0AL09_9PEZI|nr:hypothetical protein JX266_009326 [Neoarthrinium moseri]KAI1860143.1 hypothetical protein JX265_010067 [Neoarthrinium moseri]